jgi:hypothetical protein
MAPAEPPAGAIRIGRAAYRASACAAHRRGFKLPPGAKPGLNDWKRKEP